MSDSKYKFSGNQGLLDELENLKKELDAKQAALAAKGANIPTLDPQNPSTESSSLETERKTNAKAPTAGGQNNIPTLLSETTKEDNSDQQSSLFPPNPNNTLTNMRPIDPSAPRYDKNNNPFLSQKTVDRLAKSRVAADNELNALLSQNAQNNIKQTVSKALETPSADAKETVSTSTKEVNRKNNNSKTALDMEELVEEIVEGAIPLLRRQLRIRVRGLLDEQIKK